MSDDLIKRLRRGNNGQEIEAADRIEALTESNKELTLQLLATHGQAADVLDKAVVAEAKLTKAVKALRKIADYTHIGEFGQAVTQHAEARIARAVLAALEK
ncbi:hypothetical protein UFOVP1064_24 [uncultured Caudovirales phage]|uniref:Uncharacterized protein n=1 Tax=uncultured Caudovirales phage TaxID=2100421 RepID=A0A6J7XFK3_9CAUD|nr:hypothetical protein UFOVP659_51 [uncultured Caudovirales phage]CAB4169401.1 hypothetical protein UFOVP885_30 [uncultured Caudovirales phage]CAB4181303.1 hypothetical protein UFOVP1064_24 [uncultured Caudovirales phage]CAB4190158.1 hypothetical protein UFOVP1197_39 [uncultured Caudovirales phage]CAB4195977.1 hypothetical protein UFOVP1294_51 [uncultured Caudovirales phage]